MFSCMVVDDEELARERISGLISTSSDWSLVAEAGSYEQAKHMLIKHRPQACFMDIDIVGGSGMQLAAELSQEIPTRWIFTTAYSQYAQKAFDLEADDYLLKPIDDQRFLQALEKLRNKLRYSPKREGNRARRDILAVRSTGNVKLVKTSDIVWIKGAGNYLELNCQNRTYLHRESMAAIEENLDQTSFVRVHRSAIVNVNYLSAINSELGRYSALEMSNGDEVRIGKSYRGQLFRLLGLDLDD